MSAMAKKKFTLPFVVAPRRQPIIAVVGTEESGQIEIERKGYLTVAEKSFVQQATVGDVSVASIQRLAAAVAKKRGIQPHEVVESLSSGSVGDGMFDGFEEELGEVLAATSLFEERRKVVAVTCLMYFRISDQWGIDQTMEMHPDLVSELYALFQEEDARSTEAFDIGEEEKEVATPKGKQ